MSKYVVGHVSLFNNELKLVVVEAENPVHAIIAGVKELAPENPHGWLDEMSETMIDHVQEAFFDCDQLVGTLQID